MILLASDKLYVAPHNTYTKIPNYLYLYHCTIKRGRIQCLITYAYFNDIVEDKTIYISEIGIFKHNTLISLNSSFRDSTTDLYYSYNELHFKAWWLGHHNSIIVKSIAIFRPLKQLATERVYASTYIVDMAIIVNSIKLNQDFSIYCVHRKS